MSVNLAELTRRMRRAFAQGLGGAIDDGRAVTNRWGFTATELRSLPEAGIPTVIWVGDRDRVVDPAETRRLAPVLHAQVREVSGRGHGSLLRQPEVVADLLALNRR